MPIETWIAVGGAAATIVAFLIGRGRKAQESDDTDKSHADRITELEEARSRHVLELGRLTDIASDLRTLLGRQDEKVRGLERWMESLDERVLHVERGKQRAG
jgi:hypothetical protein